MELNSMAKQAIITTHAPAPVGPYSQAIIAHGLVFTAGQVGLVPETGELVTGDVQAQTRQALTNLSAVLEQAGTSLANALKTTVFLQTMDDFAAMNATYAEFFSAPPPARTTVAVAKLPKNALVEIEIIAAL
jgi:2-iminobutanoate/2-iminopropanoate deaminase